MSNSFFKKNKAWITSIVFILILSGLVFFAIIPLKKEVYSRKDEMEKLRLLTEELRVENSNTDKYKNDLAFLEKNKTLVDNFFVGKNSEINLIQKLEEMADEAGIAIEIKTLKKDLNNKKNDKENQEIFLSIQATGAFSEYMKYLYKLENIDYLVDVHSVSIKDFSNKKKLEEQSFSLGEKEEAMESEVIISFFKKESYESR
ncbi:MAG: hypothetical protein R6V40_04065 [Candidatus Moraniibacteriota bacterium]